MARRSRRDHDELNSRRSKAAKVAVSCNAFRQWLQELPHADLVKLADDVIAESSRRVEARARYAGLKVAS